MLAATGVGSMLAHGAVLWTLLHPVSSGPAPATQAPELQVEFVDQQAEVQGAASPATSAPPPSVQQPPVQADPGPVQADPGPVQADPGPDALPPPAGAVPDRAAPPGPPSRLQVNLGGMDDRESLLVTGDDVVPPRPDDTIHNRPPAYPAEAARRHAQGTVGLVVHVTETGQPAWVDVVATSGDAALDSAARDAVALWRFRPATEAGIPVPFDFAYNIRFTLDSDRRGINGQDRPRHDQGR